MLAALRNALQRSADRMCPFAGTYHPHPLAGAAAQPEETQRILPTGIYSIRLEQGRANCEFRGALGAVLLTAMGVPQVSLRRQCQPSLPTLPLPW